MDGLIDRIERLRWINGWMGGQMRFRMIHHSSAPGRSSGEAGRILHDISKQVGQRCLSRHGESSESRCADVDEQVDEWLVRTTHQKRRLPRRRISR
jgi:hypothetical protein